jgi:hypothetical protein
MRVRCYIIQYILRKGFDNKMHTVGFGTIEPWCIELIRTGSPSHYTCNNQHPECNMLLP